MSQRKMFESLSFQQIQLIAFRASVRNLEIDSRYRLQLFSWNIVCKCLTEIVHFIIIAIIIVIIIIIIIIIILLCIAWNGVHPISRGQLDSYLIEK